MRTPRLVIGLAAAAAAGASALLVLPHLANAAPPPTSCNDCNGGGGPGRESADPSSQPHKCTPAEHMAGICVIPPPKTPQGPEHWNTGVPVPPSRD
jgi:hypothetical protein